MRYDDTMRIPHTATYTTPYSSPGRAATPPPPPLIQHHSTNLLLLVHSSGSKVLPELPDPVLPLRVRRVLVSLCGLRSLGHSLDLLHGSTAHVLSHALALCLIGSGDCLFYLGHGEKCEEEGASCMQYGGEGLLAI